MDRGIIHKVLKILANPAWKIPILEKNSSKQMTFFQKKQKHFLTEVWKMLIHEKFNFRKIIQNIWLYEFFYSILKALFY